VKPIKLPKGAVCHFCPNIFYNLGFCKQNSKKISAEKSRAKQFLIGVLLSLQITSHHPTTLPNYVTTVAILCSGYCNSTMKWLLMQ